jgi:hypothetical protein
MCFSATGSFAASAMLAGIGFVAFSRNQSTRHRMYAAIPCLFAAQQAAEGVVWVTIDQPDQAGLQRLAVHVFLGFALVIWPWWMPLSLQRVEHDPWRRRLLAGLSWAGVAVAVCAAVIMVRWKPVAEIAGHSITYAFTPGSSVVRPFAFLAAYAIPTVLPFFFSSASLARTTGAALVVSLVASVAIKWNALTSVWCFFAAILSGLVFAAILLEGRLHAGSRPRPVFGRPGADAL